MEGGEKYPRGEETRHLISRFTESFKKKNYTRSTNKERASEAIIEAK